jgi:GNAT superfamily N-acetyltransferase
VGRDYDWPRCKMLSDAELAALLHDPRLEVYVLMVDGVPAGFAELDRRIEGEIKLAQFGLMPEFIGQGLGKYFLQRAIDKAWSYGPRRLWLHTCTKDHPAALPNYLKAGFAVYKEEVKDQG